MSQSNNEKLIAILSRTLNIQAATINDETSPQNAPSWDSFNAITLVADLEKEFNVRFSVGDVVNIKNVGDIKAILKKGGVEI